MFKIASILAILTLTVGVSFAADKPAVHARLAMEAAARAAAAADATSQTAVASKEREQQSINVEFKPRTDAEKAEIRRWHAKYQ